jgi:hypothetical protein
VNVSARERTVDRELRDHELAAIGLAADRALGLEAAGQVIGDADVPAAVHVLNELRVRRRGGEHMARDSADLLDAAQLARGGERVGRDQRRLDQLAHHVAGDELLAHLVDRDDQKLLLVRHQDARGVAVVRVGHAVGELHAQVDAELARSLRAAAAARLPPGDLPPWPRARSGRRCPDAAQRAR